MYLFDLVVSIISISISISVNCLPKKKEFKKQKDYIWSSWDVFGILLFMQTLEF